MTKPELERLAKLIEDRIKKIRASIAKQSGFYAQYEDQGNSASKMDGLAEALYIIREQPAEPAWIAVEDRLPEQWTVAVVASTKDPSQAQQFAYFHPFEKRWYSGGATLDVTHYFLVPKLAPPDSPA